MALNTSGLSSNVLKEIQRKAENNIALQTPTSQKTALYQAYQNQAKQRVEEAAKTGRTLSAANPWKQGIYDAYIKNNNPSASIIQRPETVATAQQNLDSFKLPTQSTTTPWNQDDYMNQQRKSVDKIIDAQKDAQLSSLEAARNKSLNLVNQQKSEVAPAYADQRNQADVVNQQNVQRLRELMAANGLNASGENVTANIGLASARQKALNDLNLQEQQVMNDFDRQIRDIMDTTQDRAVIAELEAQRAQALLEMQNRADELGYTRERDAVADSRYANEWNYGLSRDQVEDSRYDAETNYARLQDYLNNLMSESSLTGTYNGSPTYAALQDKAAAEYQAGRDKMSDSQWQTQFQYQMDRDKVADSQWAQSLQFEKDKFSSEEEWRKYTYNNMSATDRAQFNQNASQFGEEMAWRLQEMEYMATMQLAENQATINAYGGGGGTASTSGSPRLTNPDAVTNRFGVSLNGTQQFPGTGLVSGVTNDSPFKYTNLKKTPQLNKSKNKTQFSNDMNKAVQLGVPQSWVPLMTELIGRESSWSSTAKNPTSSAYGYGQFIKANQESYSKKYGMDYRSSGANQIYLMAQYVKERYGDPEKALRFWDANNWY